MTNKQTFDCGMTRRSLLGSAGLVAFTGGMLQRPGYAAAPASPVALSRCMSYGADLLPTLTRIV